MVELENIYCRWANSKMFHYHNEDLKMNEYKKLLVLQSALDNLNGIDIPFNVIKQNIEPLREYANNRVEEIEKQGKQNE